MTNDIRKYAFKAGLPIEFEIVDLKQLYSKHKDLLTHPHRTGFFHILWFQKGSPTHLIDFHPVRIVPDTLVFLNPDIVQRFDNDEEFDGKAILFTAGFFCRTESDSRFLRSTVLFNDLFSVSSVNIHGQRQYFYDMLHLMISESEQPAEVYQPEILKNLLHSFLLLAEREKRRQDFVEVKKGADLDYVVLFKDLLEQHFRTERQVNYFAEQLHITEKRLNQATSKVLGKSPKQLIDERVLLEARRLLAHTNENVKEIGYLLGFDEPTNFIKFFRKHNNSTPVEFREQFGAA